MSSCRTEFVIFTDLDGTLLDHETYSFHCADEALSKIRTDQIPLVLCTSKTRAETSVWREQLLNNHPFITENGGGIFIPLKYFPFSFDCTATTASWHCIDIGTPYTVLVRALNDFKTITQAPIKGFSDMSVEDVSLYTGLDLSSASRALQRDYDEPFIIEGGNEKEITAVLTDLACQRGLSLTKGGRFYHLTGNNDKGTAVRLLLDLYKKHCPGITSIALGDGENDIPMLYQADIAVLVKNDAVKISPLPSFIKTECSGPCGWNRAVMDILETGTFNSGKETTGD